MEAQLHFVIEFLSDYHVSAGHGLGSDIDSALLRDIDGVPTLRGTTVSGILRDGLWHLLQLAPLMHLRRCQASGLPAEDGYGKPTPTYCGQQQATTSSCPICKLFGTPRQPKDWHIHSARPTNLRQVSSGHIDNLTTRFVTNRVRIDPVTRRALPRALFSQEDGASSHNFEFSVTCRSITENTLAEAALLVAAARFVRQLGRSRRRGQGECLFCLVSVSGLSGIPVNEDPQKHLLDLFTNHWLNGERVIGDVTPAVYAPAKEFSASRYRLIVRADEPILIANRAEAGNQYDGLSFIPGTVLRGALAWQAAKRHQLYGEDVSSTRSEVYDHFINCFIREAVSFEPLYPAQYDSGFLYPSLPIPLDLLTCKMFPGFTAEGGHGVVKAIPSTRQKCSTCASELGPLQGFAIQRSLRKRLNLAKRVEMHIRVEPDTGRVRQGDLFSYVTLETGSFFVGEVSAGNHQTMSRLLSLVGATPNQEFNLLLGKASRRGYGRATACLIPLPEADSRPSPDLDSGVRSLPDEDEIITLILTSDAIILDQWGRSPRGFTAEWLSEELGAPVDLLSSQAKLRPVDGFNGKLGLPRWQDMALAAGSSATIRCSADWRRLFAKAELEGIGLRRGEGFGRIAFNHPIYDEDRTIQGTAIELPSVLELAPDEEIAFVDIWRSRLDDESIWLRQKCAVQDYTAVARWLFTQSSRHPRELKEQLATFGTPDDALVKAIGQAHYGRRLVPNRLVEQPERLQPGDLTDEVRRKEGLGLIYTLLTELEQEPKATAYWSTCIQMLADSVAAAVKPAEE